MADLKKGGKNAGKKQHKIGILLVNLGSPEATRYLAMRCYLQQFLSDRRVIEMSRFIWNPLLHVLILSKRPQKSAKKYRRIWNYATNEPPLITFTRAQAQKLQQRLDNKRRGDIKVAWAMRYGHPSIENVCCEMINNGCEKLLLFPLYPQYSAATSASTQDSLFDALKKCRFQPALRIVPSYPDEPIYIQSLATSIKDHLAGLFFKPEVLIASYHGLPLSYVEAGDPYFDECNRTHKALEKALQQQMGEGAPQLLMSFQSRFGRAEWLRPYTDETVINLAKQGKKSIAIVNPGFVSDCLETIDEMGHEVAKLFRIHGGLNFAHIPCLNDSMEGIDVLETLVHRELSGWI